MAASSPLSNFFSFLLPSKPPPQVKASPSHISVSSRKDAGALVAAVDGPPKEAPASLSAVMCPSLAYANTLYFRSAYNVQVLVDDNEPEERLLNRFRREVMRAGVIQECKRRRYHENKHDKKKRKTREAAKRNRKGRRFSPRFAAQNKPEAPTKRAEDDDNWDLPQGDIPY